MTWSGEITLDEMLNDEIVLLVMQRDGVSAGEVRALVEALSAPSLLRDGQKDPG